MDLNKLMIDYLAEEGYRPHETPFGIAFKSEGFNYLYFKDEEDEQYFRLMMPAIFVVTEDNEETIMRVMNDVNGNIKVVKLYTMDIDDEDGKTERSVWVAFEILADTTPELKDFVPRAMSLLQGARIAFLAKVQPQFVNVSLYSMDEREHDSITRLPGSWRRTMDAILGCEKAGVAVRLATPLLKENKGAFRSLATFASEHRMHLVPSIDIVPQSDHDCSNLEHACSAAELREVLAADPGIFDRGWEVDAPMPSPASKVCDIGVSRLYLNSSGNYYPCDSMHGYVLGNAATDTVEEIWRGEKLETLRRLKNKDFPQCLACANRPFCKVCPAFNFNATGDVFKTTPAKCAVAAVVKEVYGRNDNPANPV